jgi:molybdate transport system ATP-binding protein
VLNPEAVSNFSVRIQVPLDRFDLDVAYDAKRRVTGLFGVSGSGKTTWIEAVAGLRRNVTGYISCGGRVWLDSDKGLRVPAHERDIGYVPQEHLLFPHKSVRGNLLFAKNRAVRNGADFERVFANVVEVLELAPLLGRAVTDLSGGERQRVALGRALCSGPRLLLLDEPLASLDIRLRLRILPFLERVRDAFDMPILIVSHNPTELVALCDEIIVLSDGHIAASGRPMEVLTRPDIFGIAESQGFRNVLPCRMDAVTKNAAAVRLGADGSGPRVIIPRCETPVGESLFVDVAASDILVSREKPQGLSARNILPVRILSIREANTLVLIAAQIQETLPPVAVEITADALDEMGLKVGDAVHLIIKSSSFSCRE